MKIYKLSLIILLLSLMGAGCEKDDLDYNPDSIIGKWEWLFSVNGDFTASYSYPKEGQTLTYEFRPNNYLILRKNGDVKNEIVFFHC